MGLNKQNIAINFAQGINTLGDPFQLTIGKYVTLQNSVFIRDGGVGRLNKRNGFGSIGSLPDGTSIALTTFGGGLVAVGNNIKAYASGPQTWGTGVGYIPLELSTLEMTNSSYNQVHIDTAISNNNLICATFADWIIPGVSVPAINQTPHYGYTILDKASGNAIVPFTYISAAVDYPYSPKTFFCGKYFFVVFGTGGSLAYFTVDSTQPTSVSTIASISATYAPNNTSSMSSFDGVVASNSLFLSWANSNQQGVLATVISSASVQGATATICSGGSIISVTADTTQSPPVIWTSTWTVGTDTGRVIATNFALTPLFTQKTFTSTSIAYMTSVAQNGVATVFQDVPRLYTSNLGSVSDYITSFTIPQSTGSITDRIVVIRSLGLASKAFIVNSSTYFTGVYQSQNQSTYFVVASSGLQVAKLAYGNAPGYTTGTLGNANVIGSSVSIGYLFNNSITVASKGTAAGTTSSANTPAIVTTTGTALVNLAFNPTNVSIVEAGENLNLAGGFLWAYDGRQATEQGFHLYPEPVAVRSIDSTGGTFSQQTYFYQVIYETTDYRGNIFRSAPSIPVSVVVPANTSTVNIEVPRCRVTNRASDNNLPILVKVFRWATDQQTYYLVPTNSQNSKGIDSQTIIDTFTTSAQILGNEILYTTGGVAEDTATPATSSLAFFDTRLWMIDAENGNLWFSKQVIQGTPVEMSEVFTYFVPPSSADIGLTGKPKCLASMDDKLIIFKVNSIYYLNGSGPDNTGASNQYSQPIFVAGGVGCSNPNSIVLTPNGLMFQSDKGIWLLGRDLSVTYIGQGVQSFNTCNVQSALLIPNTNEVRFTLGSSGQVLLYDYLSGQWATFSGVPGISSTVFQAKHTYLNRLGQVFQETPGTYLDGSTPTVMSFTTGWINLSGIEEYVRAYRMYLLGQFASPHAMTVGIAYDFNPTIEQTVTYTPTNTLGSGSLVEQWQVNFQNQSCQAFQLTFTEVSSSTAGAGLTMSAINLVAGLKGESPKNIPATNRTG